MHTSLLEAQIFMLDFQAARWLMDGEVAGQAGNDHPTGIPTGVFPTTDGHINIAAAGDRVWVSASARRRAPEHCPRTRDYTTGAEPRSRTATSSTRRSATITSTQPTQHWVELFEEAGVPCGPINTIDQVFADPQVQHLGMTFDTVDMPEYGRPDKWSAQPINIEGHEKAIRMPPATPGEHTDEVLRGLGYGDAELEDLRARNII